MECSTVNINPSLFKLELETNAWDARKNVVETEQKNKTISNQKINIAKITR